MEFRETLLAAQRNQQQKSSDNLYYKARFDPPKKEQKQRDRLSANIQKFLAKKDEEERQKKLEADRKRQELLAMRDPKALRKIQKTLKVIKSANKSVIEDAVDRDNTAITRDGPDQPDQDDYGYESQEAAALYQKMMQKYSKIPDEPKFPVSNSTVKKDLNGTRERVKHALQHEDDPVPHKRRRKGEVGERESSPPTKYEPEKKKEDSKPEKPKIRKQAPPPIDFNQLLKLAEQKKSEPIEVAAKKQSIEQETDRLMTKKQKKEYEEELARRQRRQERLEAEKAASRKGPREEKPNERKSDAGFGRIPKLGDKGRNESPKVDRDRQEEKERIERDRVEKQQREKDRIRMEKEKNERERLDRERLDKLKAERDRIDREMDRLNRDRDRLDKTRLKLESSKSMEKSSKPVEKVVDRSKLFSKDQSGRQDVNKNIDLKSQNTYRIDKNTIEKKSTVPIKSNNGKYLNEHSSQGKPMTKQNREPIKNEARDKVTSVKEKISSNGSTKLNGKLDNGKRLPETSKGMPVKRPDDRSTQSKPQAGTSKPKFASTFDFDKHVSSLKKNGHVDGGRQFPPGDVKRKMHPDDIRRKQKQRVVHSDSEYDSEMDDFIDDGEENMDYSRHIKEIFGYDKSKYRDIDDDDDPTMESSFARQQREEYISKKIGIMEDLEDMKLEAMEKKKKKKLRRISDD